MTDDVRGALRALVAGDCADRPTDQREREVLAEAAGACRGVRTAAAFADAGGFVRLRRAVEVADRRGDTVVAERGRELLTTLERCRRATADHFHSGHGTVLPDDRQDPDG